MGLPGGVDDSRRIDVGDAEPGGVGPAFAVEATVAQRIKFEREERDWSSAKLAQQMTEAGYPLNQSAIWRIENGDPPRRVNLEEAVGFAKVFGISLGDLITPVGDMATPELKRRLQNLLEAARAYREAEATAYRAVEALEEYADGRPEQARIIKDLYVNVLLGPDDHTLENVPKSFLEGLGLGDTETRMMAFALRARHVSGARYYSESVEGRLLDPDRRPSA
jgi:transcriptional regulator with XRE-family HTH domain